MRTLCHFVPLSLLAAQLSAIDSEATHEKIILDPGVLTEGSSFGDVNGDGKLDFLAGPFWWQGLEFTTRHRYRPGEAVSHIGYDHNSFQSSVLDVTGDGKADIFQVSHDGKFHLDLYVQPEKPSEEWPMHRVAPAVGNESPEMIDVTGDGKPEFVAMREGRFGFFTPDWENAEQPWEFHPVSPKCTDSPYYHGLGIGDINGDGLTDFATGKRYWAHNGSDPDERGIVVLYWYQLVRDEQGAHFVPHLLDSDSGAGTHFMAADINGDGKSGLGIGNKKGVFLFKSR